MAAAANPSTVSPSPGNSGDDSFFNDHQSKGSKAARGVSSPWTLVVRGSESDVITSTVVPLRPLSPDSSPSKAITTGSPLSFPLSINDSVLEALPESSDICSIVAKKPAWNKPSSDHVEVGPVMDAVSWPALSEATKAPSKPVSFDSLKGTSDVLVPILQVTGTTSPLQKHIGSNNGNASSRPNSLASPGKPKHGGGISSNIETVNGSLLQSLPSQQGEVDEISTNGKPGALVVESSSSKGHMNKEIGQRVGLGLQSRSDQPQHYGSSRRGKGGSYARNDGSYNHNHAGKRDHERGNRDWNRHRSFNGRESQTQPRVVSGGFVHPPPNSTPFIPPPPVPLTLYRSPMVYPEGMSPLIYVPVPPPPPGIPRVSSLTSHPIRLPVPDPLKHSRIVNQIDYYFSYENLVKDTFLRENMDEHGWVPVQLIASFKKVRLLTDNIHLILDALYSSSEVEVQGDKVRKRYDWPKWVMQKPIQFPNSGSSSSSQNRSS